MSDDTTTTASAESTTDTSHPEAQPSQAEAQTGQGQTAETTETSQEQSKGSYTITVPEGMVLNEPLMAAVTPILQEMKMNNEQVQTLSDAFSKVQQTMDIEKAKVAEQAFQEQTATWQQEVKADKELGGTKYDENLAIASQALKQFGSPEFKQILEETGLGSNKEVIRAFFHIGKELSEGRMIPGDTTGGEKVPLANRLFPTMAH